MSAAVSAGTAEGSAEGPADTDAGAEWPAWLERQLGALVEAAEMLRSAPALLIPILSPQKIPLIHPSVRNYFFCILSHVRCLS